MNLREGYEKARTTGVVVRRPDRGLIQLTGPQRIWFLQNTITNDVEGVSEGRWVESCFLDPKGKVLAHFRVGVLPDEVWLDVDPPGTDTLVEWFTRYRFRTKVEISDRSSGAVTVLGPPAGALAGPAEVRNGDGIVFGDVLGDVPTADVHAAAGPDLEEAPPELYEILRLEAGVGRFGVDYGPTTLPQEAGLTSVLSVSKGCYVGQEVVARLHFRGHVNRVLRTLAFDADAEPGSLPGRTLMLDGAKMGTITSAVHSPERGTIGLGMVRVEPAPGSVLEVEDGGEAYVGPVPEGTKVTK